MTLTTSTMRSDVDGKTLYTAYQCPAGDPKAVVLLVHGYAEHSGRYQHVIDALTDAGYAVYTLDHRGHGKSEGLRAYVESIDLCATDLYAYFQQVKAANPGKKIFVYGHSMGALISLVFSIHHQDEIDGLITSGAPVVADANVSPALVAAGRVVNRVAPKMAFMRFGKEGCLSCDPQVEADVAADPLHYGGKMRVRTGMSINTAAKWVQGRVSELKLPMFVFHGAADELVSPRGSDLVYQQATSADKTLKHYDGMRHEPHNEIEKHKVIADMVAWLDKHA